MTTDPRLIAFYLPQFHPIPENDEWWGRGFTEWTNVGRARPLFRGHDQPRVPTDLGYYDLRVPETRTAQADLARSHGVSAFCYYHYWFGGHRLLERPLNEVVASGEPDFPFCVCWANQTWTGIWHGAPNRVLIEQTYPGPDDHRAHFDVLLPMFTDPRYVRVDGSPLFVIYDPSELPEPRRVTDLWRDLASKAGLPGLHLVAWRHSRRDRWDFRAAGFDAVSAAQLPSWRPTWRTPVRRVHHLVGGPRVHRYEDVYMKMLCVDEPGPDRYPCVVPNWDNTPRSGNRGVAITNATPELFRKQLTAAFEAVRESPADRRLVFVKSWNEWAEGNHLEPDMRYGDGYLRAIRDALGDWRRVTSSA